MGTTAMKDEELMSMLNDGDKAEPTSRKVHKVTGQVLRPAPAISEAPTLSPVVAGPDAGKEAEAKEVVSVEALYGYVKTTASLVAVQRMVTKLEEAGVNRPCHGFDSGGHSLSHWAAKRGDVSLLEYVVSKGAEADVASEDKVGMRPLHWAATEGRLACMRFLVDAGCDVDARDAQGCTALLIAAQWGQADAVAYLVKVGAKPNIYDRNEDSALHWASYKGNLEIVGLLVHLQLPVDDADGYGHTPLHLAALRGNLSTCEYLLVDASKSQAETQRRLHATDRNGKTPRQLALDKGHRRVAKCLSELRPACEQGAWTFVREKLTLTACVNYISGGNHPEAMKWPWFIMVFNKVLAQTMYATYFLASYREEMDSVLGERASPDVLVVTAATTTTLARDDVPLWVHAANINIQLLVWAVFLACWRIDPGVIDAKTAHGGLQRAYDAYFDRLVTGEALKPAPGAPLPPKTLTLCHTCHIVRPLRAKHCKVRRKCVLGFDHYCPYVGNTVGLSNYKYFFAYCLCFTLSAVQWQCLAVMYHRRLGLDKALLAAQLWFAPFIFFGCAMVRLIPSPAGIQRVTYHTQLTVTNLTTNEHMNMHRYDYFRDVESGQITNPFDKGVIANIIERTFPPPVDSHPLVYQITAHVDAGAKCATRRRSN